MSFGRAFETFRTQSGWTGVLRTFGTALVAVIGAIALISSWPSSPRPPSRGPSGPWTVPIDGEWRPRIIDAESYASLDDSPVVDPPPWSPDPALRSDAPIRIEKETELPLSEQPVREYVVKKNDSFWRIADRELGSGLRHEEIIEWNPKIRGKTLHAGMTILLPKKNGGVLPRNENSTRGGSPESTPVEPTARQHTVTRGENLTTIAKRYGVSPAAIFQFNRRSLRSPDLVPIGKTLSIPAPSPSGGGAG